MKTKNVLMLPLLSAIFLLSSCNPAEEDSSSSENKSQQSSSEDSKQSQSSSESSNFFDSSESSTPDVAQDADKDLSILKTAVENSVKSNGFKTVVSPFKTAVTGLKYSQETGAEVKTVDWDALLTADRINSVTTHSGEGNKADDYNFSLQMQNLAIGKVKNGIGPLISSDNSAEAKTLSKMIESFGKKMYFNTYYSGNDYADRLFYDVDDEKGKESNARYIFDALNPILLKALDAAGYSVYKNDNPENEATFELLSKGYLELPEDVETPTEDEVDSVVDEVKEKVPSNWKEIVLDFVIAIKDEFKDNIISSKTGDLYTLSVRFDDNSLLDTIDNYVKSLDDDWSYTFNVPVDEEETKEIVITKDQLENIVSEVKSMGQVDRFDYDITYDAKALRSGAFKFELSTDKEDLDNTFNTQEIEEGETSKSMTALTNVKVSQEMTYTTYSLTNGDSNEETLKTNLRSFAAIPAKEKLDAYPKQVIPEKKKTAEEE